MRTYALATEGREGNLPTFETFDSVAGRAVLLATRGQTSTILMTKGPDDDLTFTPVAVVSPPPHA